MTDSAGTSWWWTFAGTDSNVGLGQQLGALAPITTTSGLAIRLADDTERDVLEQALEAAAQKGSLSTPSELADAWKFADLPEQLAACLFDQRQRDPATVAYVTQQRVHMHRLRDVGPRP